MDHAINKRHISIQRGNLFFHRQILMVSRNQYLIMKRAQHALKLRLPARIGRIIRRYMGMGIGPIGYKGGALPLVRNRVAVWGFLNSEIGLGRAARTTVEALRTAEVHCVAHGLTLAGRDSVSFDLDPITEKSGTNIFFVNPRELIENHPLLPASATAGTYRIGHWAWELPVFPSHWLSALEAVDEIWVGSKFVSDAIQAATRKTIRITGYAVPDWAHQSKRAARLALGLPLDRFLFLTAFDFASYTRRKNPAAVISAFQDAFPRNNVSSPQLVLKYHGMPRSPEDRIFLQKADSDPRIHSFNTVFTDEQMCTLIDACDCFVSLHRSEGFALNIAQCMLAGMPVIATGYSGNMQFMHARNSYPISYRIVPLKSKEYLCWEGQSWAEPRHDESVDTIRSVFLASCEPERRGQQARREMLREYSLGAVGQRMKSLLPSSPTLS